MFLRTKVVSRRKYYQVIEQLNKNGKPSQRVVVSLGRISSPAIALTEMKLDLLAARQKPRLIPPETRKEEDARLKRCDRLRERIARLTEVLEKGLLPGHRMPRHRASRSRI